MQGKAYEGVKSKIARNIKVVDRVNRQNGYTSPYKHRRPNTVFTSPMRGPNLIVSDVDAAHLDRDCSRGRARLEVIAEYDQAIR